MDLSDDLPPPRRPLFLPVVLATVLLCIIGIGAGLALSARHKASAQADNGGPGSTAASDTPAGPTSAPPTSVRPSGTPCLPQTQETARAHGITDTLTQVLKIRTRTSTAYICQDGNGNFYYHANNTRGGGDWVEGKSALFLSRVVRTGDTYVATADDGVTISVTRSRLLIRHKDGTTEVQYSSP